MELADQERDIYNTESSWEEVFVKAIRTSPQYNSARSQIDRHVNRSGPAGMSAFVQSRLRKSRKFNGYITPRNGRFFTHQEVTKYLLVKFHDLRYRFLKAGDTLNVRDPYWAQMSTPISDPSFGEVIIPKKEDYPSDFPFPLCTNCSQNDHLWFQCPIKNSPRCYSCKLGGHLARDCPYKSYFTGSSRDAFPESDPWKDPETRKRLTFCHEGYPFEEIKDCLDPEVVQDFRSGTEELASVSVLPKEAPVKISIVKSERLPPEETTDTRNVTTDSNQNISEVKVAATRSGQKYKTDDRDESEVPPLPPPTEQHKADKERQESHSSESSVSEPPTPTIRHPENGEVLGLFPKCYTKHPRLSSPWKTWPQSLKARLLVINRLARS